MRNESFARCLGGVLLALGGCAGELSVSGDSDGGATLTSDAAGLDLARVVGRDGSMGPGDGAAPVADSTSADPCQGRACGAGAHCEAGGTCACNPGYTMQSGTCQVTPIGDPATRTQMDVCTRYRQTGSGTPDFFTKTATMCDPGVLSSAGLGDAVKRLTFYRWFVGLGPVSPDNAANNYAQKCAVISAWNPAGSQAHSPPPTAMCYSSEGAAGAGSSNIAWGSGTPIGAIDQWMEDNGNETTMGHRRWMLNPPLDPIGFGIYIGGNNYGSAACLQVFGMSGTGPQPDWVAFPPPGYSPMDVFGWTWTFSSDLIDYSKVQVTVKRMSDGANLMVTILPLNNPGSGNYRNATSFRPSGWSATAGEQYRVTVTDGARSIGYDVKPVTCP